MALYSKSKLPPNQLSNQTCFPGANFVSSLKQRKLDVHVNLFWFECISVSVVCLQWLHYDPGPSQHCMAAYVHSDQHRDTRITPLREEMVMWKPHEYCMLPTQLFPIYRQVEMVLFSKDFLSFLFALVFVLYHNCRWFCIKCIRVLGCKWNFIHILSKYLL